MFTLRSSSKANTRCKPINNNDSVCCVVWTLATLHKGGDCTLFSQIREQNKETVYYNAFKRSGDFITIENSTLT